MNRMTFKAFATLTIALLLAGCEMGSDPKGLNEAFLVLRADDGTVRDFNLGGYDTMSSCHDILSSESETAEKDRNSEFWTNSDFTYGGYSSDGWNRNVIIGAKCIDRNSRKPGESPFAELSSPGRSRQGKSNLGKPALN